MCYRSVQAKYYIQLSDFTVSPFQPRFYYRHLPSPATSRRFTTIKYITNIVFHSIPCASFTTRLVPYVTAVTIYLVPRNEGERGGVRFQRDPSYLSTCFGVSGETHVRTPLYVSEVKTDRYTHRTCLGSKRKLRGPSCRRTIREQRSAQRDATMGCTMLRHTYLLRLENKNREKKGNERARFERREKRNER